MKNDVFVIYTSKLFLILVGIQCGHQPIRIGTTARGGATLPYIRILSGYFCGSLRGVNPIA